MFQWLTLISSKITLSYDYFTLKHGITYTLYLSYCMIPTREREYSHLSLKPSNLSRKRIQTKYNQNRLLLIINNNRELNTWSIGKIWISIWLNSASYFFLIYHCARPFFVVVEADGSLRGSNTTPVIQGNVHEASTENETHRHDTSAADFSVTVERKWWGAKIPGDIGYMDPISSILLLSILSGDPWRLYRDAYWA